MFPSNPNFSASSPPQDSPITLQIEDWDITSGSTPENGPFSRSVSTPKCPNHTPISYHRIPSSALPIPLYRVPNEAAYIRRVNLIPKTENGQKPR